MIAVEKEVIRSIRDYLEGREVVSSSIVEFLSLRFNMSPEFVIFVVKIVLGKDVCKRCEEKYGFWLKKDKFLDEVNEESEILIYDKCRKIWASGKVLSVAPSFIVISKDGESFKISKECIFDWVLKR